MLAACNKIFFFAYLNMNINKKSSFDLRELFLEPVSFLSAPRAAQEYDKAGKHEAPQEKRKVNPAAKPDLRKLGQYIP